MATKQRTPERQQLADAIDNLRNAQRNLADAHAATETAFSNWVRVDRELDALVAEAEEAKAGDRASDHVIATLTGGGGLAELERPGTELRDKIEAKKDERASWASAQTIAKAVLEPRKNSVDLARMAVNDAVRKVIAAEVDPQPLVKDVEDLQAQLVDKQRLLQCVANQLPAETRRRLEFVLLRNPPDVMTLATTFQQYVEALGSDPDAKPPSGE